MTDLLGYYAARAAEYEKVYDKAERRSDLERLHEIVPAFFAGRHVLEVACGTGYWTRRIAPRVASMTACDLGSEVLDVLRANQPEHPNVVICRRDAWSLADVPGRFDAAFAGFWWSHLRLVEIQRFLIGLHARLEPASRVMHVDNRFVEGSNWPIVRTDAEGNTYQRRRLENGDEHEVLKNFPSAAELRVAIEAAGGIDVDVTELTHYWAATYRTG
jgi:SAM-dependent methyltransferase